MDKDNKQIAEWWQVLVGRLLLLIVVRVVRYVTAPHHVVVNSVVLCINLAALVGAREV